MTQSSEPRNPDDRRAKADEPDRAPREDDPVELPIDGELDLHLFAPRDVPELVHDYLDECRARGILQVRIVHGKGIGALRETVHGQLAKRPDVVRYRLDSETASGWGATLVDLAPPGSPGHER